MADVEETDGGSQKAARKRSPSYPFISLSAALDRLKEFNENFGRISPPADRVYLAWGFVGDTSQAQQTLAALKSFGIIEYAAVGKKRSVSITGDARTFLRAQQESIKADIVRKLALHPQVFQKFWREWGATRPPDEICLDQLVLEHRFNENTAPRFLNVYDATIAYAGLTESDKVTGLSDDDGGEVPPPLDVKVGDLIQIEIDGELKLPRPAKIRGKTMRGGAEWVFIDGTESGFPLKQVILEQSAPHGTPSDFSSPPVLPIESKPEEQKAGFREDKASLDEGEVIFRWPETLSADSVADLEYWVKGIINRAKRRAGIGES